LQNDECACFPSLAAWTAGFVLDPIGREQLTVK
jgi:hypothetical protein